jgi:heme/copper-type cytochrome/quinol oxidase subunit 2
VTLSDPATARGVDAFAIAVTIDDGGFGAQFDDLVAVSDQTITFELTNAGTVVHAFAVFGADGATELGRAGPIEPGASASVVVAFHETGVYTVVDPNAPDLTSTFEVAE